MSQVQQVPLVQAPPAVQNISFLRKLALVICLVSCTAGVIGFASNHWMDISNDDHHIHSGLFKICFESLCFSHLESMSSDPLWLVQVISGIIGLSCMAISCLMKSYSVYAHQELKSRCRKDTTLAIIGTVFMVILEAVYAYPHLLGSDTEDLIYDHISFGWSFYVFSAGVVLAILGSSLSFLSTQRTQVQPQGNPNAPI